MAEFRSDIEIAQACNKKLITEIAKEARNRGKNIWNSTESTKAKVDYKLLKDHADKPDGKLILVTAITPTPAGEGKTTTSVGLADGLRKIGKNAMVALREPSLGPVFGIKGGAAGGGYAQVVPMEDINLHFTGDFHAIGAAKQPSGSTSRQPHPAGQCLKDRSQADHLEESSGHERQTAETHRRRLRRKSPGRSQGGRLRDHSSIRSNGYPLPR